MTLALFLLDQLPSGDAIVLEGDEARHALVKRLHHGEQVQIGDGRGGLTGATVRLIERNRIELDVDWRRFEPAADPRLVVVQALPKGERAELAVELLTELGADEIVPWSATNSVARWDTGPAAKADRATKGVERWQRTAREATKQSRRPWIPTVSPLASTEQVAARVRAAAAAWVLHEDAEAGLRTADLPGAGEVVVVVGPEGGITADERALLVAAGATCVRLGPEVLRTSTAGGAALAALNVRLGRWA